MSQKSIAEVGTVCTTGDMVEAAGGNYSTLATTGGVVAVHIQWKCNLDFDFIKNCLPE